MGRTLSLRIMTAARCHMRHRVLFGGAQVMARGARDSRVGWQTYIL